MQQRKRLEPTLRHGPLFGPINVLVGLYVPASLAHTANWPTAYVALVAALAALGVTVTAAARHLPRVAIVYTAASATLGAGWLTYTAATSPYTKPAFTAFLAGAALLGALYPAVRAIVRRHLAHTVTVPVLAPVASTPGGLEGAVLRAVPDATVLERASDEHGTMLTLRLPDHGRTTDRTLVEKLDQIATAADLPNGWTLQLEPGPTRRTVRLRAVSALALTQDYPYPITPAVTSINNPFPIGPFADGSPAVVLMREVAALVIGVRGAGKSNLLNVIIAQLTKTADAIVWVIDVGKAGKLARPWLRPWMDGRTARPVIDWVATTDSEAHLMLQAFNDAIAYRAALVAQDTEDGEKITPTCDLPAIILIIDESPSILGEESFQASRTKREAGQATNAQLVQLAKSGVRLGRSEAADMILASQRITNDMIGDGTLKSQFTLRFGLSAPDGADLGRVFPNDGAHVDVRDLVAPGCLFVKRTAGERPRLAKTYRIEYKQIPTIAIAHTPQRPALDDGTDRALGNAYSARWSDARALHLRTGAPEPATARTTAHDARADRAHDAPQRTTSQRTPFAAPRPGALAADLDRMGIPPVGGARTTPSTTGSNSGGERAQFEAVLAAAGLAEHDAPRIPEALSRVASVFARPGVGERLLTATILAELGNPDLSARKLSDLLKLVGVTPLPQPFDLGPDRGRGYTRSSVAGAVRNIREGRFTPPKTAYAWPESSDEAAEGDHGEP